MSVIRRVEVLRAACCVAGLDGKVCEREHPLLQKMATEAGVGEASLRTMIDNAETDRSYYQRQFRLLKVDPDETMQVLFQVALADGRLTQEERVILRHFAETLGMETPRFEELLADAEAAADESA